MDWFYHAADSFEHWSTRIINLYILIGAISFGVSKILHLKFPTVPTFPIHVYLEVSLILLMIAVLGIFGIVQSVYLIKEWHYIGNSDRNSVILNVIISTIAIPFSIWILVWYLRTQLWILEARRIITERERELTVAVGGNFAEPRDDARASRDHPADE